MNIFRKIEQKITLRKINKDKKKTNAASKIGDKLLDASSFAMTTLDKTVSVTVKNGKSYLNILNIFYSMPKKISLYVTYLGLFIYLVFGFPLFWNFLFTYVPSFHIGWAMSGEVGQQVLAWGCIIGLIIAQIGTIGYAFLSRSSLAKSRIEINSKVGWMRGIIFGLIIVNIVFSILVFANMIYADLITSPTGDNLFTLIGTIASFVLGAITIVLYYIQHRAIQEIAFKKIKDEIDSDPDRRQIFGNIDDPRKALKSEYVRRQIQEYIYSEQADREIDVDEELKFKWWRK